VEVRINLSVGIEKSFAFRSHFLKQTVSKSENSEKAENTSKSAENLEVPPHNHCTHLCAPPIEKQKVGETQKWKKKRLKKIK
jgi:hypothetical protein